jgi:hypothetical protein
MNRTQAITDIKKIFAKYKTLTTGDRRLLKTLKSQKGKLYELYVLSQLVINLSARGFRLRFIGTSLKFKANPGVIKLTDPHFVIQKPNSRTDDFYIFVDIEVETTGYSLVGKADLSRHHEVDVIVTTAQAGYPKPAQIALGVECKAFAHFEKGLVKEALGVRRELGLLYQAGLPSVLSVAGGNPKITVPAKPASEFWLAFTDPKGLKYKESPSAFGIDFKHLQP